MIKFFERLLLLYRASLLNRVLIILLGISASVMILSHISFLYVNRSFPKETIESGFAPLKKEYGVDIVYEIDDKFFSPLAFSLIPDGPSKESKVEPIPHRVLLKYPNILKNAFKKYPINVIRKHLKSIHFAGEIIDSGFSFSGSYDPFRHIVFLVDSGWKDDLRAEITFHHEFSSLLLKSKSLVLNPWFDQNPADFEYNNSDEIDKKIYIGKEEYYEKGFLNRYSFTCFENDFNEFSGMIFTYPKKFKQIMDNYPRVRGKFLVWLKFYQEIDPHFTEEYFFGQKTDFITHVERKRLSTLRKQPF